MVCPSRRIPRSALVDVPRPPDSSLRRTPARACWARAGALSVGDGLSYCTALVTAQPGRAEVLTAGESGDGVLVPSGAVDHDDLGHAAGAADGGSVGRGARDVHRAEISQRQDAAAGRAARRLHDDLGRGAGCAGQGAQRGVAPALSGVLDEQAEVVAARVCHRGVEVVTGPHHVEYDTEGLGYIS